MGLLMRAPIIAILLALLGGCSPLRLQVAPRVRPQDWSMQGGDLGRTNVARESLAPPLTVAWTFEAAAGFGASPAVTAESVAFIGTLKGEVEAVRLSNGRGIGGKDFGSAVTGTPALDNDMVYVPLAHDEESLIGYDYQLAVPRWRARAGGIETSPLLLGRSMYVTTLEGKLHCIDRSDGTILWSYELPRNLRTSVIRSSPASDSALIFFGSDNGDLSAVSAADGKLRWSARAGASILGTPSVRDGYVYAGSLDSTMYAFRASDGQLRWKRRLAGRIYGAQAVDGTHVYVGTAARTISCLDAATGAVRWTTPTDGVMNAAPLVSGRTLYAGSLGKTLYALDTESGAVLWQFATEGRIKTTPVIAQHLLLIFVEDRMVLALKQEEAR
jgi:outer membrane protein assembly factor BamB